MKYITIGDCHGENFWKDVLQNNAADKFVFLGDYVDAYGLKDDVIYNNLIDIIDAKQKNPDKIELLLGNHDLQYFFDYGDYVCSGFRETMFHQLNDLFHNHKDLFKPCFQVENYLWIHAGIGRGWFQYRFATSFDYDKWFDAGFTLGELLEMQFNRRNPVMFDVGPLRGGSNKHGGGIFWADKNETYGKPIVGYHQQVGHTPVKKVTTYDKGENTSITYCDTRAHNKGDVFILET